ncbi:proteoglycan 4-like [Condylostylus longicornis]|uniref:proteoglycan 4-like n=1 Tax=Condylostylus longicornis TaxID=2530218 RepID=UPI00244E1663|nr:proteoglycan 4-like [Condylostylus longicornis]
MNWKSTILFLAILYSHSTFLVNSVRIPPRFSRNSKSTVSNTTETVRTTTTATTNGNQSSDNEEKLDETFKKIMKTTTESIIETTLNPTHKIQPTVLPYSNRRAYSNPHILHKSLNKVNQTSAVKPSPKNIGSTKLNSNTDDYDTLHMGVAVPLTQEDLEREIASNIPAATNVHSKLIETSTPKGSLSTWILLNQNEQNDKRMTPTPIPLHKEAKVEKIQKPKISTTMKPKYKPSSSNGSVKPSQKPNAKVTKIPSLLEENNKKVKIPNEKLTAAPTARPTKQTTVKTIGETLAKKIVKKASATMAPTVKTPKTKATTTTTTTTEPPSSSTELIETTPEPPVEVSSTTVESTTFLIMEPKDADFDLPADRSPGTTKKPKKNKSKKNKNKNELSKKPSKLSSTTNKEKPLATKIYNYLAREVMPTVGMGLVGLTVAAGLATYFLAPFGALRRSYEITDRKDELPPFPNDEYAPKEGATEEENYSQIVAPNSPYRNSIRYTLRQPGPNLGPRPMGKFVQGPVPPAQYRIRNVAPPNYPAISQPQYNGYGPNPLQRRDQYPQQFYRYTNDPQDMYRQSTYLQAYQEQQLEKEKLLQEQLLLQQQQQPQQDSAGDQLDNMPDDQHNMMDQHIEQTVGDSYFPEGDTHYYENHQPSYSDIRQSFIEKNVQPGMVFSENPYQDLQSTSMQINSNDKSSEPEKSFQTESNSLPMIVTPEPNIADNIMITNENMPEDNILRRRSQFIVGSIQTSTAENDQATSKEITVEAVPEHGPRRRRRKRDVYYQRDTSENEIDTEFNTNQMGSQSMNVYKPENSNIVINTTPKYPSIKTTVRPYRDATRAVQTTISEISAVIPKYLRAFERLINELRIISNHAIHNNNNKNNSYTNNVNLDKNPSQNSPATSNSQTNQH